MGRKRAAWRTAGFCRARGGGPWASLLCAAPPSFVPVRTVERANLSRGCVVYMYVCFVCERVCVRCDYVCVCVCWKRNVCVLACVCACVIHVSVSIYK